MDLRDKLMKDGVEKANIADQVKVQTLAIYKK